MADLLIRLSVGKNGELSQFPRRARVNAGDNVFWVSDGGALTVAFDRGSNPFRGNGAFRASRGRPTAPMWTERRRCPSTT